MRTDRERLVAGFTAVSATEYGPGYGHPEESRAFFAAVMEEAMAALPASGQALRLLDIGCGNGYWLRQAVALAASRGWPVRPAGVDLTPALVEMARASLADVQPPPVLVVADVLADGRVPAPSQAQASAHAPTGGQAPAAADMAPVLAAGVGAADLCFLYDVVQQIHPADHALLLERLAGLLSPGGLAVLFDRDPWSRYGLKMRCRKVLTRRLGLRLVPPHYLLARYPSFRRLKRLARRAGLTVCRDRRGASRRSLVLRRPLETGVSRP